MTRVRTLIWAVLLALFVVQSRPAAHEVRPAYLEMRAAGGSNWSVLWKVPAFAQAVRLRVDAKITGPCETTVARRAEFVADAYVERWTVRCPHGLAGTVIRFDGLPALRTEVLLRIEWPGGNDAITGRATPSDPSFIVPAEPSLRDIVLTYGGLGVEHILFGFDHLLFVLALMLIVRGWRRLALTITAFTLGHSVTLAAATLGAISLPGPPVEAAIALSILIAAAEALRFRQGKPSFTADFPWIVALCFGLLHGMGFAGALEEIGIPRGAVLPALLFFNVGVEIGQLLFVGAVLGISWLARRLARRQRFHSVRVLMPRAHSTVCYAVGTMAAFWLIERVQAFWS